MKFNNAKPVLQFPAAPNTLEPIDAKPTLNLSNTKRTPNQHEKLNDVEPRKGEEPMRTAEPTCYPTVPY